MAKINQLETLVESLLQQAGGIVGCAVISRAGQGDMLYAARLDGIDSAFLSTVMSSVLLIGERLGHELGDSVLGQAGFEYGESAALILPCSEEVALLVALKGSAGREAAVAAAREAARNIGALLKNPGAPA
jgi:predicted regulator of Ras-like GTPase activity (Roadblock/LC7/MglB family)